MRRWIRRLVPGRIRNSYAAKFGLALAAVLLVVSAVGGVVYAHTGATLEENTQRELETAAAGEADQVAQWLETTRAQQSTLANSRPLRANDEAEIAARLASTVDQHASVKGSYHVNVTSGELLAIYGHGTIADDGLLDAEHRDRVASLVEANATVTTATVARSEVFRPAPDESPVFLFVANVESDEHRAVVSVVDVPQLSRTTLQRRSDGRTIVANESGTVVLALDESRLLADTDVDPGDGSDLRGFLTATDAGGDEQAVGYARVSGTDWVATTRVPTAVAYSLQTDISRGVLAMLLVAVGGAVAIGLTIGRNTVRSVRELAETAGELEAGTLDVELDTDRTDEFGRLYAAFDSMRDSLREQIETAERAREEADRRRAESERFAERLEATADEYGDVMAACSEGDLTRRMDPDAESEAMATIAREFNEMMDRLEATLARAARFADEVAAQSEQVTASSEDVRRASQQVSESVQSISDGAERQHEQFRVVSSEMDDLAASVQQVAASADDVAEIAERTAETGRDGREAAESAIEEMDAVERSSRDAAAAMSDLQEEIEEIERVVELILDLTEQTDMVALNARIEAARGGAAPTDDDGVIAEEVRSLADETKSAAAEIEERIERVRDQTEETAAEVHAASETVADSAATVRGAADALEEIAEHAEVTNEGVQEIRAATGEQATATEEVVATVGEAAEVSRETTAEAETVAAAAEEQASTLTEVADSASVLADRADRLQTALDRFETDAAPDGTDAAAGALEAPTPE